MAEQLTFPLAVKPALGRDDFFVSEANQMAVVLLEDWKNWPLQKMVLIGPEGAGKTHLAHVWAGEVGATLHAANALKEDDLDALAATALVIEDIDEVAGNQTAETNLFHLHNFAASRGHPLLMTSEIAPNRIEFKLKDLQSRLAAANIAVLDPMDDELLSALLLKLFSDRQINVPSSLLSYVLQRLPRSYASAQRFVAEMDRRALRDKTPIGISLAREVIQGDLDNSTENKP